MQNKDRNVRRQAGPVCHLSKLENTFVAALNAGVKGHLLCQIRRYQSAQSASSLQIISPAVYDNLVQTVRANLEQMHWHTGWCKEILDLDELHMYTSMSRWQ